MPESQKALADRLFPISEESDDQELRNIPPEQRRLHTETSDFTVSTIYNYMVDEKIEIPEFQRSYVWSRAQASRLIESLIIQCPIPVVYFSQSNDNKLIVIDGNQRLLTIKLFLADAFELQGLSAYPELNGQSWSSLDPRFRDHILNRTIRCITISKETHPQIKFDVFERLNTGSVKLNAQELRHGINHGPLIKSLDAMAENKQWRKLVGIRKDTRMKGAELVLRFLALRYDRRSYVKPLSSFLDQFTSKNRNASEEKIALWTSDFNEVLDRVSYGMGPLAFRFYDHDLQPGGSFNAALYDAQMLGFAETKNRQILSGDYKPKALQLGVLNLLSDQKFANSVRQATSDEAAVRTRIELFKDFLDGFKYAVREK